MYSCLTPFRLHLTFSWIATQIHSLLGIVFWRDPFHVMHWSESPFLSPFFLTRPLPGIPTKVPPDVESSSCIVGKFFVHLSHSVAARPVAASHPLLQFRFVGLSFTFFRTGQVEQTLTLLDPSFFTAHARESDPDVPPHFTCSECAGGERGVFLRTFALFTRFRRSSHLPYAPVQPLLSVVFLAIRGQDKAGEIQPDDPPTDELDLTLPRHGAISFGQLDGLAKAYSKP